MHIDYSTLSAYCDGDLDAEAAATVEAHLRDCEKYRAEVRFIQDLGDGLRALPTPSAPDVPFDEIVPPGTELVPSGSRPARRWWPERRWSRLAAAAVVLAVVGTGLSLVFGAGRLMAGASTLTLRPVGGGGLALRYETLSHLVSDTHVRARIRYWVADSLRFAQNAGRYTEIELSRTESARFEGVADLPPGTVYAAVTIEDLDATYVESGFGRPWEYIETEWFGRPTLEARRHQLLAALEFNTPRAGALAEQAASEFPEQPEFRLMHTAVELAGPLLPATYELPLPDAARFDALDRAARDGDPGPIEMHALIRYARLLERPDAARYWEGELRARHPRHGATALATIEAVAASAAPLEEKLEILEADWARIGAPATAQVGLNYARELADPILAERWLSRHETTSWNRSLSYDTYVARRLMGVPELWSVAEPWILDRLAESLDWTGPARRLDQLRHDFEAERRENRAHLYQELSRIRIARGDSAGAIDALERSVAEVWDPRVFVRAAEIHRALGADARAAELIGLARVDPVEPLQPYLSAEEAATWGRPAEAERTAARAVMRERIRSGLLLEQPDLNARLRTSAGQETTLGSLVREDPGVTLVVYATAPGFLPGETLALLELNADGLVASGVRSVFVTEAPDSTAAEGEPGDRALDFHYDPGREVNHTLRIWRSIQYFVLDRGGRLRHRGEDLDTALRISLVLGT